MKHCMLDIETLGTTPGAVVLSIGAVAFELERPQKIELPSFFATIDIDDSIRLGLRLEAATLKWWLQQRPETLKAQMTNTLLVQDALMIFAEWLAAKECTYIWGNSASFDMGILSAVYRAANIVVPWEFRNERCYRTVINLCGGNLMWTKKDTERAHNPVYDCWYQIEHLHKAMQLLNVKLSKYLSQYEIM